MNDAAIHQWREFPHALPEEVLADGQRCVIATGECECGGSGVRKYAAVIRDKRMPFELIAMEVEAVVLRWFANNPCPNQRGHGDGWREEPKA